MNARCFFCASLVIAALSAPSLIGVARGTASPSDVLASHLDTSTNPAVDFFQYANGGWLKAHPIPPSESSWGIGNVIQDETYQRLRLISEQAAASQSPGGSEAQKIGDFWATALDSALAERQGLAPLQAELDRIDGAKDLNGLLDVAFSQLSLQTGVMFLLYVGQDQKHSDVNAVQVLQDGLGLPDRDYYFNSDENSVRARTEYPKHVQGLLDLSGASVPGAGDSVLAFETRLAGVSRKLEDLRDPEKNYNKLATGEITSKLTPSIDWPKRLTTLGLQKVDSVIVGQPEYLSGLDAQLKNTPLPVLKQYFRFHLISGYAEYLGHSLAEQDFAFYHRVLSGQQEPRARWKRALDAEEEAIGMVLGKLYVKQYFSEAAKKRYSDLVEDIRTAYRERISRLDWMSDATKQKALAKLAKVGKKVGYPDKWKDYSALTIGRESWAANMMNASRWRYQDRLNRWGKPVDRAEWHMTPQTYNAYYSPSNNEIVLPAAIFIVPGVKDEDADDALVYGYAAAGTIGHEITHGFDDDGRQFDADGNLKNWWTEDDVARFKQRADRMVQQFKSYEPLPGMHINGEASLGENIADLGGVLLGLDAFKKTRQFREGKSIAALTPLQRYFLGYALGWMSDIRKENLARRLMSDVHAPAKWRVNGPMANVPDFYQAFGVRPGDPMWRADSVRVSIW
ncbi:MAG: M13 family metallopeptidase [Candidatus Eiseniibacteriota bacterium]